MPATLSGGEGSDGAAGRLRLFGLVIVIGVSVPSLALGGETILQMRTAEDPTLGDWEVCEGLSFPANLVVGVEVWSYRTRAADGAVVNEQVRRLGTAVACAQITDVTFTPFGSPALFYIRFTLREAVYAGLGTCTVTSNDVPVPQLILGGCTLRLVEFPEDVLGGTLASATVFNPFRLAGFQTGSFWTLRLYTRD